MIGFRFVLVHHCDDELTHLRSRELRFADDDRLPELAAGRLDFRRRLKHAGASDVATAKRILDAVHLDTCMIGTDAERVQIVVRCVQIVNVNQYFRHFSAVVVFFKLLFY